MVTMGDKKKFYQSVSSHYSAMIVRLRIDHCPFTKNEWFLIAYGNSFVYNRITP